MDLDTGAFVLKLIIAALIIATIIRALVKKET